MTCFEIFLCGCLESRSPGTDILIYFYSYFFLSSSFKLEIWLHCEIWKINIINYHLILELSNYATFRIVDYSEFPISSPHRCQYIAWGIISYTEYRMQDTEYRKTKRILRPTPYTLYCIFHIQDSVLYFTLPTELYVIQLYFNQFYRVLYCT